MSRTTGGLLCAGMLRENQTQLEVKACILKSCQQSGTSNVRESYAKTETSRDKKS